MMMMKPQQQIQIHTLKKTYTVIQMSQHNNANDCYDDADNDDSGLDKLATRYSCSSSSVPVTLTDFSKHGQVDFYKAADSISDYLASIFPRLSDLFYLLK